MADSPDRYKLCAACPNRHQADLLEALGEVAKADGVRTAGCGWWQEGIPSVDGERGFMVNPLFTGCFKPLLPSYIITVWHSAGHSAAAFNDARDKVIEAVRAGNGAPALHGLITMAVASLAGASEHQIGRGDDLSDRPRLKSQDGD